MSQNRGFSTFFWFFQVFTNLTFPDRSETIRNGSPVKFYVDICLGRFEKLFLGRKSSNIEIFQQNSLPNPCISLRVYNGFSPAPPNIFATAKNTTKKQKLDLKSKIWSVKIRETYILLTSPSFVQNAPVEVVVEFWRSFRHKKIRFFSWNPLVTP